MTKGTANPSHITGLRKNGLTRDSRSSSWIIEPATWMSGYSRRSRSDHCRRRMTIRQSIEAWMASSIGNQNTKGRIQTFHRPGSS